VERSYWAKTLAYRLGRRRTLALAGGLTGAALLAACGSSHDSGTSGSKSDLLAQPVDTTKQARRGGTYKDQNPNDAPSLEVVSPIAIHVANRVYSTLVRQMPGVLKPSGEQLAPDIAESWEFSPDGLQITMKLRQGVKWHNKAPVNGRPLDIDDVLFSWNRYAAKSSQRGFVSNAANPAAPVLSFTAPDQKTVVIKLTEPLVYALELFASFGTFTGNVVMVPKETDGTFDIRNDMIGTGPFTLDRYSSSVGWTVKRNQEYFDPDWALLDQIETAVIPEYATSLAQFKAGNLHQLDVKPEDLLSVKREEPRLLIYPTDVTFLTTNTQTFGVLPEGKSPFLDERVRQAASLSLDRDLWIDTFHNVSKFNTEGLPLETRWNSHLLGEWDGWWLDPRGKDFGANAKFFQHDIAEGKKLLAAAGYPSGFDVTAHYPTSGPQSTENPFENVVHGMNADIGIRVKIEHADYNTQYIPLYRDGQGQFEGETFQSIGGSTFRLISPVAALAAQYWSKAGTSFKGFSTSGKNDKSGDPQLNSMIEKARLEHDTEKRRALTFDVQRYLAKAMYGLYFPGGATAFTMAWPALSNFRVHRIASRDITSTPWGTYRLWIDNEKAPFKKT
jgi:peptide/nickel transport system substrate-binding protein